MRLCLTNGQAEIIMNESYCAGNAGQTMEKDDKKERMEAAMDGGSAYHAETEEGRKRIPALHP